MQRFFKQFSFPGGIGSHSTPETPGSIHEGGELGYSVSHAYGAVFDNPDLIALVVVGDGEVRDRSPGHLLAHQQISQPDPRRRGAARPASQRLQDQQPDHPRAHQPRGAGALFVGYGWTPYFVEGSEPESMHQAMAATLEQCVLEIRGIQQEARQSGKALPAALADDRPAQPQGVDRRRERWTGTRSKASGGRTRSRLRTSTTTPAI